MKTFTGVAYAVFSACLLTLGWYEWGSGMFLLIGFIPLLLAIDSAGDSRLKILRGKVILFSAITFLTWNLLATWWIKNASFAGLIAAMVVTSFLMSVPVVLYTWIRGKFGRRMGYFSLILLWLAYEYIYNHGEISWPWLTLGNGFLFNPRLVQWYEFTGIFGGSLWVLVSNIAGYELLRKYLLNRRVPIQGLILFAGLAAIPPVISIILYSGYKEEVNPREVIVVQPNIDPYMKFNDIPSIEQTRIQVMEAMKLITPETDYIVCPETSIVNRIWTDNLMGVPDLQLIKHYVELNPRVKYVTGIMCRERYSPGEETVTAMPLGESGYFFDTHNSAIQIDTTPEIPIYHKSKLVTGVEKMPYSQYLGFLRKIMLNLGGIFRSHGIQKHREVFQAADDDVRVAPVICYESVFGEFVGEYIKRGANVIFVITNDGWWGDTPGHRQHNGLSTLRAIETRRSIARSANTGISSFINQRGDVQQSLGWWKRGALIQDVNLNDRVTFYVRYGDYIGRGASFGAVLLLLLLLVQGVLMPKKRTS